MFFLLCILTAAQAVDFEITNKEIGAIWVGIQGNADKVAMANGGFILGAGATVSFSFLSTINLEHFFVIQTHSIYEKKLKTNNCSKAF